MTHPKSLSKFTILLINSCDFVNRIYVRFFALKRTLVYCWQLNYILSIIIYRSLISFQLSTDIFIMRNLGVRSSLLFRRSCCSNKPNVLIYNRKNKTNEPLKCNKLLKWYVCGPTVYDSMHIGHAR